MSPPDVPAVTRAASAPGHLQTSALDDGKNRCAIHTLHKLIITSRGPNGSLKMLHNDVGGHVTLTSSCSRILGSISVKNPLLKLLVSCVRGHCDAYTDCGLFTCGLALSLIRYSLELDIHRHLITDIYELLMHECLAWLDTPLDINTVDRDYSHLASCKFKFDTCSLDDMRNLAAAVLSSKPGCNFWPGDLDHMTSLVVTAFLRTSADATPHNLQYVCIEGCPSSSSYIADGVLYPMPSIPPYRTKPLSLHHTEGQVLVAVFNTSLAGDTSEKSDADLVVSATSDVEGIVLDEMRACCERLVELGVGVVACQRVVHPSVRRLLRRDGVLVMDRLGIHHIYSVTELTGARLLSSFTGHISASDLGCLDAVHHRVLEGRSHLQLTRAASSVCTLVLYGRSEESLAEIKSVCQSSYHTLQMAWSDGLALAGGGCWQNVLAAWIRIKAAECSKAWSRDLGCSPLQLMSGTRAFCRALTSSLPLPASTDHMTDAANHHRWHTHQTNSDSDWPESCMCQAVPRSEHTHLVFNNEANSLNIDSKGGDCRRKAKLLDSYSASVNAVRIGVSAAVMLIGVHNVIEDRN